MRGGYMGNNATLDEVTIQINASAAEASANIDSLIGTLSELQSATKTVGTHMSRLAEGLQQLTSVSVNFESLANNMSKLGPVVNALQQLSSIESPRGFTRLIKDLDAVPNAFNKIATNANVMQNITRVSNQLAQALTPLAEKLQNIANGFNAITALASKYGVQVSKIANSNKHASGSLKDFQKTLYSVNNGIGKGLSGILKVNQGLFKGIDKYAKSATSKLKQIGLSLLGTRTIFTATRKAVSEYMAMDADLTWQVTNNWRALGAQLAPAIEYVTYLFKQFVRVIYSVVLALTGIDLIARANEKALRGMGKSAKDTLGNLQKFDDLNVAEFPKGEGNNSLIEMDPIDLSPIQKIIDWVRRLKEEIKAALDTGDWAIVGKVFAEGINDGLKAIKFNTLNKKLKDVAKKFGDFLQGFVNELEWDTLGTKLTEVLKIIPDAMTSFLQEIPWSDIGKGLDDFLKSFNITDFIGSILNEFNTLIFGLQDMILEIGGKTIATLIGDFVLSIINGFDQLISGIKWEDIGKKIREIIENMPWEEIFNGILKILKNTVKGAGNLLDGLFDTTVFSDLSTTIQNIINDIGLIGTTILETLGEGTTANNIFKTIESIISNVSTLANDIADTLTEWVISESFQKTTKELEKTLETILKYIDEIIKIFKNWWEESGRESIGKILSESTKLAEKILPLINILLGGLFNNIIVAWVTIIQPILDKGLRNLGKLLEWLNIIGDFLTHVFSKDWEKAFEDIQKVVDKVWGHIKESFRNMVNGWIGYFEKGINTMIDKLNWLPNKINKLLGGDLAKALGINFQVNTIDHVSLPRLETGTNEIPYEGLYHLHPGEAVVPKKYNPAVGGTNDETNSRLDTLINILQNMDTTTIVNVGNKTLYKEQQQYNKRQADKYGTNINI
jgi:hypothetical protein